MADNIKTMTSYRYNVKLKYMGGSEDSEVKVESIKSIIIDHNYDENCMPIIYLNMKIDRKMADDMIQNRNNAYFLLTISKFDSQGSFSAGETCINVKCMYFVTDELNKLDPIDYSGATNDPQLGEIYGQMTIGLLVLEHLNNNKVNCTQTAKQVTCYELVKDKITDHMKNIEIKPFTYNEKFDSIIIPPTVSDTVNKTLDWLNNQRVFYDTPYRFYQDFNGSYIIPSDGSEWPQGAGRIVITMSEIDDMTTNISGLVSSLFSSLLSSLGLGGLASGLSSLFGGGSSGFGGDSGGSSGSEYYEVRVNYANVRVYDNTVTNISRNKIRGTMGATESTDKELSSKSDLTSTNLKSQRMNNDNEHMIENIKAQSDNLNFLVYFSKNDLDTNIFTINKAISIKNIDRYQELNGRYLMFRKRELYLRETESFVLHTMINLKRIDGSGGDNENHKSSSGSFFSFKK